MPNRSQGSLIAGRSNQPLSDKQIRSVGATFYGLDREVEAVHDPQGRTRFVVETTGAEEVGKIYFGPDIFPGNSVVDPNSALSMKAAAAHEISHYHRWVDATELPLNTHTNLDEALTSLDAALRFHSHLSQHEIDQLIRDAIIRLQILKTELLEESEQAQGG